MNGILDNCTTLQKLKNLLEKGFKDSFSTAMPEPFLNKTENPSSPYPRALYLYRMVLQEQAHFVPLSVQFNYQKPL
jgi:hypothetical protein